MQSVTRLDRYAGKVHVRNTAEQMKLVGPRSLGVSLLTAGFVGMVFTIQVGTSLLLLCNLLQCMKQEPFTLQHLQLRV